MLNINHAQAKKPVVINTAGGGDPKDFNSVRLAFKMFCEKMKKKHTKLQMIKLFSTEQHHLVQGVEGFLGGKESRFCFLEVGGTVLLLDGHLDVDLVNLDLLLVC